MSKLGGNSPSADTDKSNNLVGQPGPTGPTGPVSTVPGPTGPAGADSTVPGPTGPTGPVSTVPGPAGNDGVVQTVVAGTNMSVDSSDPANPILNASAASGGQVDSVVGGTNCTVDATDPVNPIVNAEGQVETIVGGTNTTIDNTDPKNPIINVAASSSPTTTKGDLIARGASADIRLAVGANDNILVADSAEASGMKWEPQTPIDPAPNPLTTKGDVYGFSTLAARIPVGTNDQVLTADSTNALGLAWKDAAAGGGSSSSILFDVTLTGASQTIGVASLGNLTEFDFEIYVPNVVTVVNLLMYINGDTTAANYRTQSVRTFTSTVGANNFNDSHITFVRTAGPTLILGKARLVDGHFTCITEAVAQESTAQTNVKLAGQFRELTDTDLDAISFDTGSGTNVLPIGTRLIIRDPSAAGAVTIVKTGRFAPPKLADFPISVGFEAAVVVDDPFEGFLLNDLTTDGAGGGAVQARVKTMPSGAWTATAKLDINYDPDNFNTGGMLVRDSATDKTVQLRISPVGSTNHYAMFVSRYTGDTFNSDSITALNQTSKMQWFRIENNLTNFLFSISHDGVHFFQIHSESVTAHTANIDQVGFFINPTNDAPMSLICSYWNDKDLVAAPIVPLTGVVAVDPNFKPPLASIFPLTHLADNTFTDEDRGLVIAHSGSGTLDDVLGRLKTVPSGDWTLTARFDVNMPAQNFNSMGIVLHDEAANKSLMFRFIGNNTFAVGVTRYIADNFSLHVVLGTPIPTNVNWMRVVRTASGYSFELSSDGIIFWVLTTTGLTTHGTVDQIGMFLNPHATAKISMTCTYWDDPDDPAS